MGTFVDLQQDVEVFVVKQTTGCWSCLSISTCACRTGSPNYCRWPFISYDWKHNNWTQLQLHACLTCVFHNVSEGYLKTAVLLLRLPFAYHSKHQASPLITYLESSVGAEHGASAGPEPSGQASARTSGPAQRLVEWWHHVLSKRPWRTLKCLHLIYFQIHNFLMQRM